MNKKGANFPIIILGALLIVAIVAIAFMFYNNKSSDTKSTTTNTNSQTTQGTAHQSSITDCGSSTLNFAESLIEGENNFDCFIEATRSCAKSKFRYTTNINWFGVEQTSANYYEIKGMQSGSCIFYVKLEDADLSYSDRTVQSFLDSGMSQEEINQQEQETRSLLKSGIGKDGTCRYANTQQLVDLLNGWKQGDFSTEDFDDSDCSGKIFEIEEITP